VQHCAQARALLHLRAPHCLVRGNVARVCGVCGVLNAKLRSDLQVAGRGRPARGKDLRNKGHAQGGHERGKLAAAELHNKRNWDLDPSVPQRLQLGAQTGELGERKGPARLLNEAPHGGKQAQLGHCAADVYTAFLAQ
jgi:hypothetical protein